MSKLQARMIEIVQEAITVIDALPQITVAHDTQLAQVSGRLVFVLEQLMEDAP